MWGERNANALRWGTPALALVAPSSTGSAAMTPSANRATSAVRGVRPLARARRSMMNISWFSSFSGAGGCRAYYGPGVDPDSMHVPRADARRRRVTTNGSARRNAMTVGYEVRDEIAYISFNRPEKHNALRDEDLAALGDALRRLDAEDDVQIGILFGRGRSFSSGGDVNDRLQRSMDEGTTMHRPPKYQAFHDCVTFL